MRNMAAFGTFQLIKYVILLYGANSNVEQAIIGKGVLQ